MCPTQWSTEGPSTTTYPTPTAYLTHITAAHAMPQPTATATTETVRARPCSERRERSLDTPTTDRPHSASSPDDRRPRHRARARHAGEASSRARQSRPRAEQTSRTKTGGSGMAAAPSTSPTAREPLNQLRRHWQKAYAWPVIVPLRSCVRHHRACRPTSCRWGNDAESAPLGTLGEADVTAATEDASCPPGTSQPSHREVPGEVAAADDRSAGPDR